uniref:Protein JASON n=1 Tax=Kalanchoe fedtschenkoi TaxID=63787 RepID=A0A7N0TPQ1_KALFE
MGCFLACFGSSKDKKGRRLQPNRVPSGARDQRRGYNPVEQVVYADESFKPVQQIVLRDGDVLPAQQAGCHNEGKLLSATSLVSMFQNQAADEFGAGIHGSVQEEASPIKSNLASPGSLGSRNQAADEFGAGIHGSVQEEASPIKSNLASPGSLVSRERSPDKSSSGGKKKVSFNSVVKTYEAVAATREVFDEVLGREEFSEKEKTEASAKSNKSNSLSEAGSNTSSLGSYPQNHRYQNCRESDDEEDELDYEESDMAVDEDDGDLEEDECSDGDVLTDSFFSMESTGRISPRDRISPEIISQEKKSGVTDSNHDIRGRDAYDQSVLNPVENLSQWKALKARGKPPLQPQKENSALDLQELPVISFSSEPNFNPAASFKSKLAHPEHQKQQMAVDASLSNWLMSPEPINKSKPSPVAFQNAIPQQTMSQGSYSPKSLDDRPILGALTVEELRLMSRTSSPRRSPTKSPDDMAIIGSVGSYWSHEESDKDSGSVSSYKGIPNTTSKYREDKRVNWHSTPFEARLEKALNQGSAEA